MSCRVALALGTAALITGCATGNPLISWDRKEAATQGSTDPMAQGKARAAALRNALEAKRAEQVGGTVDLNNALLGLGILSTGLALGHVHRDAYTVTAGLAGTAFLFGQQNLQKPRISLYESGIKAVNCALRAVAPIDMGAAQRDSLLADSAELSTALGELRRTLAQARTQLDNATANGLSADGQARAQARIDGVAQVGKAAVTTQGDVADLLWRLHAAGNELTHVVEAIGAQVNELTTGTVGDPANVPTLLSGLAGIAGRFAPGLGVDTRLSALGKPAGKAGDGNAESADLVTASPATAPAPAALLALKGLNTALAQAERASERVDAVQRPLAVRLSTFKGFGAADALKSCGVSDLALQLVLSATELTFKLGAKQGQTVVLSGGVKPYVARLRESEGAGVEIKSPVPGDSTLEINVPASITEPQQLHVDVMDSANPRQLKTVLVSIVGAAPAKTGDGAGQSTALAPGGADKSLREALLAMKDGTLDGNQPVTFQASKKSGANVYSIQRLESTGGQLLISLDCKRGSAGKRDASASVRDALLARLVAQINKGPYLPGKALASNTAEQIKLQGVASQRCLQED